MEKLLNAIVSKFTVRTVAAKETKKELQDVVTVTMKMFDYRDVDDEVKEVFKKELNNHLFTKLQELKVGEYVDYAFAYDDGKGTFLEKANSNMAEVLSKLPALNDGEEYSFPCNTYIGFTLVEKNGEKATVKPNYVSTWIEEAYSKQ